MNNRKNNNIKISGLILLVSTILFFVIQLNIPTVLFFAIRAMNFSLLHEVKNQNNEVKEIFEQKDIVSAFQFQLEILKTGYEDSDKYKKDIDGFLSNEGINGGKTIFVDKYCYAEFKIINLVATGSRIDGRQISATKVEDENNNNLDYITFYPSNNKNNTLGMSRTGWMSRGDWKTGVVAFDCAKTNNSTYMISFSSCALRGGCGDENENSCLGNSKCPYKSYQEYKRDIKFKIQI
jgi:hypothetical protein